MKSIITTAAQRHHRGSQSFSPCISVQTLCLCGGNYFSICTALFLSLTLLLFPRSIYAQSLPALPQISFDNFEPTIRTQLHKAYDEAQSKPLSADANGELGMALHAYNQYEFAAICYTRARQLAPKELRWHYYFGLAQAALAKNAEAIAAFKTALQLAPNDLPTQVRLAETYLAAGQYRDALPIYETLAKQKTTNAQAQYGLGQIKIALGEKDAGVAYFRQAISLLPEFGAAHYSLGLALRSLGQKAEAQKYLVLSQKFKYQRPLIDDPLLEAIANLNASATDQLSRGVVFANMGKLEPSIAAHERALELNSKLVQAHINLISLYAQTGKLDKAEQHYHAAVAENPNLADSHFNYGIILMSQDRYAEAAEAFKRAFERNPFYADAHYNYGIIIEREGKLDEAATHFQLAIDNNPEHRMAHFSLGRIFVNQNKFPEAIAQFRQTLTPEDEETPRLMYALGATLVNAGQKQEGLPLLRQALQKAKAAGQTDLATSIERDLKQVDK